MENNGKGINVFYGVIGVATLIITIVGATFAYFSANAGSEDAAITATGAEVKLTYSDVDGKGGLKTNLIPVDETLDGFQNVVGAGAKECLDDNGNPICSVYTFKISNPATVSQRVYGSIEPQTNTFTNLKMAIFKGTPAQIGNNFDVDGTAVSSYAKIATSYTADGTAAERKHQIADPGDLVHRMTDLPKIAEGQTGSSITIPAFEQVLDPNEEMTYTIVLWIHETGSAQNDDQKASFAGGVYFTTEAGEGSEKTGVTGVISATSGL